MLINPSRDRPSTIPGTRILETTMGIVGIRIPDPHNAVRVWEIQGLYAPIDSRMLGGVRAKLVDQRNFITFCNQRDLEVLLGLGAPGNYCPWLDEDYRGPNEIDWYGFCCDEDDLLDDLFEREMFLRASTPGGVLSPSFDIERRVHLSETSDCEELFVLLGDMDPETGLFPDTRFETLERRWIRSERRRVRWERS